MTCYLGGQLTSHGVATASTAVYGAGSIVYFGSKLQSLRDTTTNASYAYGYDANGRALSATAGGGTGTLAQSYNQAYSFSDPALAAGATVGNLERVTDGGAVVNYDYMQDRLVSMSNSAGATLATNLHDHVGRLTSKRAGLASGTETEGFVYDLQDQLRQVRRGGVVTEKLEYDPTGSPLYRMVGNQAIYYVGPFATVTATANAGCTGYSCAQGVSGVQVSAHVILGGSRIASVRASSVLYYHRDQRGSVIATTTTGGAVGAKYRYGPYGQLDRVEGETAANASELGFTGGLRLGWNPATAARAGDLLLLGARVYDAALRRWLQADLADEKRYTYTDGDPVNYVDPSGRMRVELFSSGLFDSGGSGGGFALGRNEGPSPEPGDDDWVPIPCRMEGDTLVCYTGRPGQRQAEEFWKDFMLARSRGQGADGVRYDSSGGRGRVRRASLLEGIPPSGEALGSYIAGERNMKKLWFGAGAQTVAAIGAAALLVAIGPVGWSFILASVAAGAIANVAANALTAVVFEERCSLNQGLFDAAAGGALGILPGTMAASALKQTAGVGWSALSAGVKSQVAWGSALSTLGPSIGVGALKTTVSP